MMMCLIINLCFKHVKYRELVLFSGRTGMWGPGICIRFLEDMLNGKLNNPITESVSVWIWQPIEPCNFCK
jgi:hypothetical protein